MTRDRRRAGAFLVALGGLVAMALLAGPASAQTTTTVIPPNLPAGSTAVDGSVSSGTAYAARNSTASGDAVAINNSTASGCADAINTSTASGDSCGPGGGTTATTRPPTTGGGGSSGGGGATSTARLALTGSWSAPMVAMAALAVVLGSLLLVSASGRRRLSQRG